MKFRFLLPLLVILAFAGSARAAGGACSSLALAAGISGNNCYFVSPANGADTNAGTTEAAPFQHAPGMPGCASTCLTVAGTIGATNGLILRGEVFPSTSAYLPWAENLHIGYVGYDPAWNDGTIKSIKPTLPGAGCTAITVGVSGGGGSSGAGTANFQTTGPWAGFLQHVTLTNAGSSYTSNPTISFAGSTCTTLPTAVADIYSPVLDGSSIAWTASNLYAGQYMVYMNGTGQYIDNLEVRGMTISNTVSNSCPAFEMFYINGNNAIGNHLYGHNFGTTGFPQTGGGPTPCEKSEGIDGGGASNGYNETLQNSWIDNWEMQQGGTENPALNGGTCGWSSLNTPLGSGIGNPLCNQSTLTLGFTTLTRNVIHDGRGLAYDGYGQAQNWGGNGGNTLWNGLYASGSQHGDGIYFHNGGTIANNAILHIYGGSNYIEVCSTNTANCSTPNVINFLGNTAEGNLAGSGQPFLNIAGEFANASTTWSTNPTINFWNNTCLGGGGTGACFALGQLFLAPNTIWAQVHINLYNNHAITDQSGSIPHWFASAPAGSGTCTLASFPNGCGTWNGLLNPNSSTTQAAIDPVNLPMTQALAATDLYTLANNYNPTSSGSPTNGANFLGTNLTSNCSGNLVYLCTTNSNPASLNASFTLPATGATWPAGAYSVSGSNPTAGTPTFSPVAGTYTSTQSVAISSSASTIICYNTTGAGITIGGAASCPGGSTLVSGPVAVNSTETLYAVAGGVGYLDSAQGSAAYTINLPTSNLTLGGAITFKGAVILP